LSLAESNTDSLHYYYVGLPGRKCISTSLPQSSRIIFCKALPAVTRRGAFLWRVIGDSKNMSQILMFCNIPAAVRRRLDTRRLIPQSKKCSRRKRKQFGLLHSCLHADPNSLYQPCSHHQFCPGGRRKLQCCRRTAWGGVSDEINSTGVHGESFWVREGGDSSALPGIGQFLSTAPKHAR